MGVTFWSDAHFVLNSIKSIQLICLTQQYQLSRIAPARGLMVGAHNFQHFPLSAYFTQQRDASARVVEIDI